MGSGHGLLNFAPGLLRNPISEFVTYLTGKSVKEHMFYHVLIFNTKNYHRTTWSGLLSESDVRKRAFE